MKSSTYRFARASSAEPRFLRSAWEWPPPPTTRSASSTPSACFAKPRRRSARSRSWRSEFAARDADVQKLSKQVRDLQAALDKDGATMSETERRNKERDLANLSRDLQRGQREFREDLNLRRNEELASVQERANKVIQQIAEAEKFDLILQDPVVFASQKHRHHRQGDQGARRQVGARETRPPCAPPPATINIVRAVPLSLAELALHTGALLEGDGTVSVARVATLESAGAGAIAFLANPKYRAKLAATRAVAVIVAPEMADKTALPKLVGPNPYAIYAKVAAILHAGPAAAAGVHPSAIVAPRRTDRRECRNRPLCRHRCGRHDRRACAHRRRQRRRHGASIGDDVILHANVTIYDRCSVGPRCILHSGVVIGADGFGMAEENGVWLKIPQIGRVVIGADCGDRRQHDDRPRRDRRHGDRRRRQARQPDSDRPQLPDRRAYGHRRLCRNRGEHADRKKLQDWRRRDDRRAPRYLRRRHHFGRDTGCAIDHGARGLHGNLSGDAAWSVAAGPIHISSLAGSPAAPAPAGGKGG